MAFINTIKIDYPLYVTNIEYLPLSSRFRKDMDITVTLGNPLRADSVEIKVKVSNLDNFQLDQAYKVDLNIEETTIDAILD